MAALDRLFSALLPGGDTWALAALPRDGSDARDTFGEVVLRSLCVADDPPLHLDLFELFDEGKPDEHYATIRFDYPGTWEIVEPDAPAFGRMMGGFDPSGYATNDPKSMQYRRS